MLPRTDATPTRPTVLVSLVVLVAIAASGCAYTAAGRAAEDPRPGLADVRVMGPKGRKCFDFCAVSESSCKQMCPSGTHGECQLDCEADSRTCLEECPELQRPVVKEK